MDLPPALEAAWGLRDQPRRGPKPGLTLPRILEAAIRLADRDGLEAVSMARVAAELGAAPMSLYRHVTSKDDLLELMTDTAWGPPPAPLTGTWREQLAQWARTMRQGMYAHPWALRVPVSGLPLYPNNVAWFEQGLAALADTPISEQHKASTILLVSGYVRNEVMTGSDVAAAVRAQAAAAAPAEAAAAAPAEAEAEAEDAGTDGEQLDPGAEWMRQYRDLMMKLADPVRFPATARLLESGVFDANDDPDDEFDFGLDRILDGIARLIE
jgi:AcrR family transcriptional regulator